MAVSEAEDRYGHIVHPSVWDILLDLCLGKGLATKRHKSGLEKAYLESVAARRAAGENVILPGEYSKESFPGPRAGLSFSAEDDEEDNPEKLMFDKFVLEDETFDLPHLPPIYPNINLDEAGNPRRPTDLPGWFEWDYGRRHLARERGAERLRARRPEAHRGYGYANVPDPEISRLTRIFRVREHACWRSESAVEEDDERSDEEETKCSSTTRSKNKNGGSSTVTTPFPLTTATTTKGESSRTKQPSLKGKERATTTTSSSSSSYDDDDDGDFEYGFDACANDSGCALFSCSSDDDDDDEENAVPREFLDMH